MRLKKIYRKIRRNLILNKYKKVLKKFDVYIQWNPKKIKTKTTHLYYTESPLLISDVLKINFSDNIFEKVKNVYAAFDRPLGNKTKNWYNVTENYALCDKYCTFPSVQNIERLNKAVLFRSNKKYLKGHQFRHSIVKSDYLDIVELDGSIKDLSSIYSKYKVAIVIENCDISGYVSEKFFDAIKCGCQLIYWGDIKKTEELGFKGVLSFDINDYEYKIQYLCENYSKQISEQNLLTLKTIRDNIAYKLFYSPSMYLITGER